MVYGLGWFPTVVVIRLSQPPAGDWLTGAWAELGKIGLFKPRLRDWVDINIAMTKAP